MSLSIAAQFENIMSSQTTRELVPFLLQLEEKDVSFVRAKALEFLKAGIPNARPRQLRGWTSHAPLSASAPGGLNLPTTALVPATPFLTTEREESALFFLTALATYTHKEAFGDGFNWWGSLTHDFFSSHREEVRTILQHARPAWLSDWLMDQGSSLADYWVLRELEDAGFIAYRPHHFAFRLACLPLAQSLDHLSKRLIEDDKALTRDLPLQFEHELSIARLDSQSAANYQKHTWQRLLLDLCKTSHLDRADLLTRCLLALRRDFRRPLLTWFRDLFLALKPTFTERLARQAELTELLAHPQTLVVNFALDQLKDMHTEPGFNLAPLLLSAESLLIRPDLKTGLRSLVTGLARLPFRVLAPAPTVASLLTTALTHPDTAVQKHAAQGLAGLLSAPQPLLTPAETAAALAALAQQADYLSSAVRPVLAPWLAAPAEAAPAFAAYAPLTEFIPDISPATAIVPVADWHELLFLTGQVLQHQDPAARERWLDGLLRLQGQLPAGYAEQLHPYLTQVVAQLNRSHAIKASDLLTEPLSLHGHDGLFLALLLGWADRFATPRVAGVSITGNRAAPLLVLERQRYLLAETRLRQAITLPLLSTPTHQPHWVAPSALLARLLSYQMADVAPAAADLALALARSAHAHPAEAAQALHRLSQLADTGLRALLTWFFGPADQPLPALPPANGRQPAQLATPVAEALPELWAVAARTKIPTASFPTLAASLGYDYAGVAQPLRSLGEAIPDSVRPTLRFATVVWRSGAARAAPSPLLLYAPPVGQNQDATWKNSWPVFGEFPHLAALLPNYPAPLYAHVLREAAWASNLESSERDLLLLALHSLLGPGTALETAATAVLASGLIHHTPPGRSLAQEVLLQAIAHGRLRPAVLGHVLGHQLATGYAPASRLADGLRPLLTLDDLTADALGQTLDALLPGLPAAPPRNLRPLLNTYADLLARTRRAVPAAVRPNLLAWQQAASLKAVAQPLLARAA